MYDLRGGNAVGVILHIAIGAFAVNPVGKRAQIIIQLHARSDDVVRLWRVDHKAAEQVRLNDLQFQRMPPLARDHLLDKDFPVNDLSPKKHRLQLLKGLLSRNVAVLRCRPLAP